MMSMMSSSPFTPHYFLYMFILYSFHPLFSCWPP
jgi:hypothetical protein